MPGLIHEIRRVGESISDAAFSKLYLGDETGACEDWRTASARGANDAAPLLTEYCKD
jgi:hypothetical protein